ncbi:Hsp20/alpha crystallin family protein [Candidatus Sulfurimonas marisnigri]|uniref:Hsp20/alpha crystallin family protein n=1 Tax=Candidatus Sulfurimonas marisnigri TaxID=2740405 RepID=A0A7S7LYJ4_9BACT|nr:Hsp20/alpha crystallin family protein [Candidatus Sulfurimonas marisnigri]QOY53843.1 Hsp20/alpha crystallin family protein [Candidatus Sulfurimonas marisnigri]
MDFGKLVPWNWFKKEEEEKGHIVPVKIEEDVHLFPASIHELQTEFDGFLDSVKRTIGSKWINNPLIRTDLFKPSLDVASDGKEYSIKVELPGMDKNNISIECTNNILKIKGEKHQEKEEKKKDYYRIERSYGSFERILDIPDDADSTNITSSYKDGVLSVVIPRKVLPKKETRRIEITSES